MNFYIYDFGYISISQQTWHTSSQRNDCYGSHRISYPADTTEMCSNVPYKGSQNSDKKYRHYKCWPAFSSVLIKSKAACLEIGEEKIGKKSIKTSKILKNRSNSPMKTLFVTQQTI